MPDRSITRKRPERVTVGVILDADGTRPQSQAMAAFERAGHTVIDLPLRELSIDAPGAGGKRTVFHRGEPLSTDLLFHSSLVNRDATSTSVLRAFRDTGTVVVNHEDGVDLADDKYRSHLLLTKSPGLPRPDAALAASEDELRFAVWRYGYPVFVKRRFGACGDGVFPVENEEELREVANALWGGGKQVAVVVERGLMKLRGVDFRVVTAGGVAQAWGMRSTLEPGGRKSNDVGQFGAKYFPVDLPARYLRWSVQAVNRHGLDYGSSDWLLDADSDTDLESLLKFDQASGHWVVSDVADLKICEVNSSPWTNEVGDVAGVDLGEVLMNHALARLSAETIANGRPYIDGSAFCALH